MSLILLSKQHCRKYATLLKILIKSKLNKIHGLNSQQKSVEDCSKCNALQQ